MADTKENFLSKENICSRCFGTGEYTQQQLNASGTTTPVKGVCFKCNGTGKVERLYLPIKAPIDVLMAIVDITENIGRSKMTTIPAICKRTNFLEEDVNAVISTFVQIGYLRYYKPENEMFYGLSKFGWEQIDLYRSQIVNEVSATLDASPVTINGKINEAKRVRNFNPETGEIWKK